MSFTQIVRHFGRFAARFGLGNSSARMMHKFTLPAMSSREKFHLRQYSGKNSTEDIKSRVLKVVSAYDKVKADTLTVESHFMNDLGLDSLDHVEVIMALEDEFGFEINDSDAEKMQKPADIIKFVTDKEKAKE